MAVLGQHVGHHDGREVHGLVGVGREQSVRCKAVAQRVIASFVVPQVQEGWFWEVGRCYWGDLIVFVALVLAIVGLKRQKDMLSGVLQMQNMLHRNNNSNNQGIATAWQRMIPLQGRQSQKWPHDPARLLPHSQMAASFH